MALIDSKQLNPRLTGSFSLSGSLEVSKGDLSVKALGVNTKPGSFSITKSGSDSE